MNKHVPKSDLVATYIHVHVSLIWTQQHFTVLLYGSRDRDAMFVNLNEGCGRQICPAEVSMKYAGKIDTLSLFSKSTHNFI